MDVVKLFHYARAAFETLIGVLFMLNPGTPVRSVSSGKKYKSIVICDDAWIMYSMGILRDAQANVHGTTTTRALKRTHCTCIVSIIFPFRTHVSGAFAAAIHDGHSPEPGFETYAFLQNFGINCIFWGPVLALKVEGPGARSHSIN